MKRVVISSVLTLLIILLVGIGFYYYNKSSLFKSDPLSAVPPDAAFILSGKHAGRMLDQLFRNDAWRSLSHGPGGSTVEFLDSLFRSASGPWNEQQLVLSVHVTKAGSFDCLFLLNATTGFSEASVTRRIEEFTRTPAQSRRYENVTIRETAIGKKNFACAVSEGVLLCSFTSFLVEDAIRQLKTGTTVTRNAAFRQAAPQDGSETTCYINYAGLGMLTSHLGSSQAETVARTFASFAGWSAMETNLQSHAVLMSGLTAPGDTNQLSALFTGQFPVVSKLQEIVPARTAFLLSYGFSNSSGFLKAAEVNTSFFEDTANRRAALRKLDQRLHADVHSKMTSWIGNQVALLVTESGNVNFANNTYLCIETASTEDARKKLDAFRRLVNRETGLADKQETYRSHTISFLNIPDLAPLLFGKAFSRLGKFYYTSVRNYVVAGNTASALRSFLDDFEEGKTLSASDQGKEAFASLSNAHNLFLYMHLPAMQNILRSYGLAGERSQQSGSPLQAFTTLSFSLSSQRNGLQTSLLLNRVAGEAPGIRLIASAKLDTSLTMQPCLFATASGTRYIAVQDAGRILYLLDETGEVLWKKQLPEIILGEIHAVDYFRNGNVQLLFNTVSSLHLLDTSGAYTGNYPIRLPSLAVAGATVIPADALGPERIYMGCRNGQLYAYEISGKPLSAWVYNAVFNNMENPVLSFTTSKNLLVLYNSLGEVRCLDEAGNEVGLWSAQPFEGIRGRLKIFRNDSTHQSLLSGLDGNGKIVVLTSDGKIQVQAIPSDSTIYDATLWTGPGTERIFLAATSGGIHAFDASTNSRFHLPLEVSAGASFQEQTSTGEQIAFFNGTGKIYLLNREGQVADGFPVKGSSKIASSASNGTVTWVTGDKDGTLYIYEMH